MSNQRHFLGWDSPFVLQVEKWLIQHLTSQSRNKNAWDFSPLLILVSNDEAGRKLKARLTEAARQQSKQILLPKVHTEEQWMLMGEISPDDLPVADAFHMKKTWLDVLQHVDENRFPILFGAWSKRKSDTKRHDSFASTQKSQVFLSLSDQLGELQKLLAGAEHDFSSAGKLISEIRHEERERWDELATLENYWRQVLRAVGLQSPWDFQRAWVKHAHVPPGITDILLAGMVELSPACLTSIRSMCREAKAMDSSGQDLFSWNSPSPNQGMLGVHVLIHAPEMHASGFDDWGRIQPAYWQHVKEIPLTPESIHLQDRPSQTASWLIQRVQASPQMGVGLLDTEISPHFKRESRRRGIELIDTSGELMRQHEIFGILSLLNQIITAPNLSWKLCRQLLQYPRSAHLFPSPPEDELQPLLPPNHARLLLLLDEWKVKALWDDLPGSIQWLTRHRLTRPQHPEHSDAVPAVQLLSELKRKLDSLRETPCIEEILQWIHLFYSQTFESETSHNLKTQKALEKVLSTLSHPIFTELDGRSLLPFALQSLAKNRYFTQKTTLQTVNAPQTHLYGWRELLWSDDPQLLIAGLSEGVVPSSTSTHAWLPGSIRGSLQLSTNEAQYAHDLWLLNSLLETRQSGRVQFVFHRRNENGDALKPSRFFFLCSDSQLVERLEFFYAQDTPVKSLPGWNRTPPWRLRLPDPSSLKGKPKYSPTLLRDYLDCPFRTYLRHWLHWEDRKYDQIELDARAFGTLCHEALQAWGEDEEARDYTDERQLADYLEYQVILAAKRLFPTPANFPMQIQIEWAINRLRHAAPILIQEYQEGWRVLEVEFKLGDPIPWSVGGHAMVGRLDRVEYNIETSQWRIVDFKTFSKAQKPLKKHLAKFRPHLDPEWTQLYREGQPTGQRWIDLQLPLYLHGWAQYAQAKQLLHGPVDHGSVSYLLLGSTKSDVVMSHWFDANNYIEPALQCASEIISRMKSGLFWPPHSKPTYDNYAALWPDGPESAVAWETETGSA